jgi:uncharacterized protein YjiK
MKKLPALLVPLCFYYTSLGQPAPRYDTATIVLPEVFDKAVQISSLAWAGDSLYLPTEKCGTVLIGKLDPSGMKYREVYLGARRQTEGMAYYKGNFYLSDDSAYKVYKYNKLFDTVTTYPIKLRAYDERITGSNGFEGITVVNDSVFYLLLEKDKSNMYSVLYKGVLRNNQVVVTDKRRIAVDRSSRYSDIYLRDSKLYLVKSSFYGGNCNTKNRYELRFLELSDDMSVKKRDNVIETDLLISLTGFVLAKCDSFNTNVEGITMDNSGNFYIVSDNFFGNACEAAGQRRTLLMRVASR